MRSFGLKYDQEHYNRLESVYVKKIEQLYLSAIRESIIIAQSLGFLYDKNKPFSFSDYPQIKYRVDKLFDSLNLSLTRTLYENTENEWFASVEKNDDLVNRVLKSTQFKREQVEHLYNRNIESLAAFQNRKIDGKFTLSDKVWKYTNQFKGEIEMGLDVGLSDGRSAAELSRDLRQYLKQPDKLFRRVRDKRGELVLSQNAKKYHPGAGVYRSSYKNALRMTRTEVNMAYRASDYERQQQLDFVVGIEVRRSNRVFACSVCEALKGRYPKNFKFLGWHPQCRCHSFSILSTTEEFIKREKARMAGEDVGEMKSVNEVTWVPESFMSWINKNQERIDRAKTKPYFITDNLLYAGKKNVNAEVVILMDKAKQSGPEINLLGNEIAKKYNGYVTPINYKSEESITRKLKDELNGDISEIKDSVRNTIVAPKNVIDDIIKEMKKDSRFVRVNKQLHETNEMGYSGVIGNVKTKNGLIGEIQVNTDKMIYAKEKPSTAKLIIGEKRWSEIRKETGLEGGLGHEYYEQWRILDPKSQKAIDLAKKSIEYYAKFQ